MSRIETKHPRRLFPALGSDRDGAEGGRARALARLMAFEGALGLARAQMAGSPALGDLAEDEICPLARRNAWAPRLSGGPLVA